MPNVTDQFVPTGVYSLTNVATGKRLSLPQGQDSLQVGPATNDLSDKVCASTSQLNFNSINYTSQLLSGL